MPVEAEPEEESKACADMHSNWDESEWEEDDAEEAEEAELRAQGTLASYGKKSLDGILKGIYRLKNRRKQEKRPMYQRFSLMIIRRFFMTEYRFKK